MIIGGKTDNSAEKSSPSAATAAARPNATTLLNNSVEPKMATTNNRGLSPLNKHGSLASRERSSVVFEEDKSALGNGHVKRSASPALEPTAAVVSKLRRFE